MNQQREFRRLTFDVTFYALVGNNQEIKCCPPIGTLVECLYVGAFENVRVVIVDTPYFMRQVHRSKLDKVTRELSPLEQLALCDSGCES